MPLFIIIGWHLGLGALIQSSANSIWLAEKLGRRYCLYWGRSCLYNPYRSNPESDCVTNLYPDLFCAPANHSDSLSLEEHWTFYPSINKSKYNIQTIPDVDLAMNVLAAGNMPYMNSIDIRQVLSADVCVIYQYMTFSDAISIAQAAGYSVNEDSFRIELIDIYRRHFMPNPLIRERALNFSQQRVTAANSLVGMHIRGSDKITEKPLPSIQKYVSAIRRNTEYKQVRSLFVATDQESYLKAIANHFRDESVISQDITRSVNQIGVHCMQPYTNFSYQNGLDMLVDIELLSHCESVFAFPGSQVHWWLSIKRQAESLRFRLIDVLPGRLDRMRWFRHLIKTKAFSRTCKAYVVHWMRQLLN